MLVKLEVPFVDAGAADLALTLGAPLQPAISAFEIQSGEYRVELRLLGCSHQAVLASDGYELSELVACQPGQTGPLPTRLSDEQAGRRYEFCASTRALSPPVYRAQAERLMASVGALDQGLVGTFPQPDGAFTALRFRGLQSGHGIGWETWHGYPQTGEIVFTKSEVSG
jgi:Protein of unknown function DUF2617